MRLVAAAMLVIPHSLRGSVYWGGVLRGSDRVNRTAVTNPPSEESLTVMEAGNAWEPVVLSAVEQAS